jgi:transcriptional regulator with XRE-family HTH domain
MDDYRPPMLATLGELLRYYIAQTGLTQQQFAHEAEYDPAVLSRILSGTSKRPRDKTLEVFCRVFRSHGLAVDLAVLLEAREIEATASHWKIPPHWIRLIYAILRMPPTAQDRFYASISNMAALYTDNTPDDPTADGTG